jgi:thiosulfate/3-mercaptopyruvate sulfurtransferase
MVLLLGEMNMYYRRLITCEDAARQLDNPNRVFVDCRYNPVDPVEGEKAYQADHIVGAVYCHLDRDLSGTPKIYPGSLSEWIADGTREVGV